MIDSGEVDRRVQFIRQRCQALDPISRLDSGLFVADLYLPTSTERHLHLACEACVELGLLLISGLNLRRPTSYEEIFDILVAAGLASPEAGPQLERIVKMRNLLVHGYSAIEPHALQGQLAPRIMDIEFFVSQVVLFVRRMA